MSASYGQFASELRFSGGPEPAISERMITVSLGRQVAGAWSVRALAGAVLDGELAHGGRTHDVGTGWLVGLAVAHRWTLGERYFATAVATAGVSWTRTQEDVGAAQVIAPEVGLRAVDVRVGALAGVTLAGRVSPYVLGRVFGGPVSWRLDGDDITGSDQHHYQLGAGVSVALPRALSVLVDASAVGERSLSIGLGMAL